MPPQSYRVTVDPIIHKLLTKYSAITGQSMVGVIDEALNEWLETVGVSRMEQIAETHVKKPRLVIMPKRPPALTTTL